MDIIDIIYHVAKVQNIVIKDVEKQAGVAQGFLSRLRKLNSSITLEKVERFASVLKVPKELLLFGNNDKSELFDAYLLLWKLISKTNNGQIIWNNNKTKVNKTKLEFRDMALYVNDELIIDETLFPIEMEKLKQIINISHIKKINLEL